MREREPNPTPRQYIPDFETYEGKADALDYLNRLLIIMHRGNLGLARGWWDQEIRGQFDGHTPAYQWAMIDPAPVWNYVVRLTTK